MPHPDNKPPISTAPISVIIPVRDQLAILEARLQHWMEFLRTLNRDFEVLVIDYGSSDGTRTGGEGLAAKNSEMQFVSLDPPAGFGDGLKKGLELARHPLLFYTTLDYPYQPSNLNSLLAKIDEIDIAVGYRKGPPEPLWYRLLNGAWETWLRVAFGIPRHAKSGWFGVNRIVYARLIRFLFGVHVQDVDIDFKLFRREVFDRIPIQSKGVFVHTEIIAKANFLTLWMMDDFAISPLPGTGDTPPAGELRWGERWDDLWRLLKHPDFGSYPPVRTTTVAPVVQPSPTPNP